MMDDGGCRQETLWKHGWWHGEGGTNETDPNPNPACRSGGSQWGVALSVQGEVLQGEEGVCCAHHIRLS